MSTNGSNIATSEEANNGSMGESSEENKSTGQGTVPVSLNMSTPLRAAVLHYDTKLDPTKDTKTPAKSPQIMQNVLSSGSSSNVDPATVNFVNEVVTKIQAQFDKVNQSLLNMQLLASTSLANLVPSKRKRSGTTQHTPPAESATDSQQEWNIVSRRRNKPRRSPKKKDVNDVNRANYFESLSTDMEVDPSVNEPSDAAFNTANANNANNSTQDKPTNSNTISNNKTPKPSASRNITFGTIRPLINKEKNVIGKSKVPSTTNKNLPSSSGINDDSVKPKKVRVPPIIADGINVKDLLQSLIPIKATNFKFKNNFRTNRTTIYAADRTTYDGLFKVLKENGVPFHTQSLPEDKRNMLILKKVPNCFNLDDIISEISKFNLGDKVKVVSFKDNNKANFNYYILSVAPDVNLHTLLGSHRLFYTTVTIEKFNRTSIPQCFKCSELGHVQNNCFRPMVCHKCGESHSSQEECKVTAETPNSEKFCNLCKEKGHAASYKGCPTYKKALRMRIDAKNQRQSFTVESARRMVDSHTSFAQVASGGTGSSGTAPKNPPPKVSLKSALSFLDEACMETFNCTYAQFQLKYRQFHARYTNAMDREVKKSLLFDFLDS